MGAGGEGGDPGPGRPALGVTAAHCHARSEAELASAMLRDAELAGPAHRQST